jgi:hypothetical protein
MDEPKTPETETPEVETSAPNYYEPQPDEHQNSYLFALRILGLLPLIIGGVIALIALIVYAVAANPSSDFDVPDTHTMAVSTGWIEIGAVLFIIGFLTTALWLVAAAINSKLTAVLGGELEDDDIPAEDQH